MNKYLKGIKTSNDNILNEIYEKFYPNLKRFILNSKGNEADAKDIFQEALIATFKRLQKNDFEINTTFDTYIFSVGKFIWFRKLKKKRLEDTTDESILEEVNMIEEMLFEEDRYSFFHSVLETMNEDCQKILTYFFEKRTFKEIRELMNLKSVDWAKRKKMNCKNKLVNLVKSDPRFKNFY